MKEILFQRDVLEALFQENKDLFNDAIPVYCPTKDEPTDVHIYRIKDLLFSVFKGYSVPYVNNRGIGVVNAKTAKNIAENFMLDSISEITVGLYKGKPAFCDGHGRIEGLLRRLGEGNLTEEELNGHISVRHVPAKRFLEVYRAANDHEQHTNIECLRNKDYALGEIFSKLEGYFPPEVWSKMANASFYQQMSYIILYCASGEYKKGVEYKSVFKLREETKEVRFDLPKQSELSMRDVPFDDIVSGINFYLKVVDFIKREHKTMSCDTKITGGLLRSKPLMSLIVLDAASGERMFGKSHSELARRMIRKGSDIRDCARCLTTAPSFSGNRAESELRKLLSPGR